jgi:hypothetical protein
MEISIHDISKKSEILSIPFFFFFCMKNAFKYFHLLGMLFKEYYVRFFNIFLFPVLI